MAEYVLSLSYGKDSLACLGACDLLGIRIDRIIHAEIWATDTIPAELPMMVDFKNKADKIIKDRWGINVEHYKADSTYEECFYHKIRPETIERRKQKGMHNSKFIHYGEERDIWGFPIVKGVWCNSKLKMQAIRKAQKQSKNCIQVLGIAVDEEERVARHSKEGIFLPLVEAGWTEQMCRDWCIENDLLSPIYQTSQRGGCWFCHNQGVDQLRLLRNEYPELWALMMKWDNDSPTTFKPNGKTVHDFDRRFAMEDEGLISPCDPWKWGYLKEMPLQLKMRFD